MTRKHEEQPSVHSQDMNYTAAETLPQNEVTRYCTTIHLSEKLWVSQNMLETEHILIFTYWREMPAVLRMGKQRILLI